MPVLIAVIIAACLVRGREWEVAVGPRRAMHRQEQMISTKHWWRATENVKTATGVSVPSEPRLAVPTGRVSRAAAVALEADGRVKRRMIRIKRDLAGTAVRKDITEREGGV